MIIQPSRPVDFSRVADVKRKKQDAEKKTTPVEKTSNQRDGNTIDVRV